MKQSELTITFVLCTNNRAVCTSLTFCDAHLAVHWEVVMQVLHDRLLDLDAHVPAQGYCADSLQSMGPEEPDCLASK